MRLYLLRVIVCLSLSINSLCAQQYYFSSYSVEQGLPQSEASSVIQDSRGFLWVGTNGGGVCRFDGQKFKTLTKKQGLIDEQIKYLFEDSSKNLWFFSLRGVSKFDGKAIKNYTTKEGFPDAEFFRVYEDKQQRLWVFTQNNKQQTDILYLQNERFVSVAGQHAVFNKNPPLYLFQNKQQKWLITTRKGLWQYDENKLTLSVLNQLPELQNKACYPLFENNHGRLWLRVDGKQPKDDQLYYYQNNQLHKFNLPVAPQKINQIFEDSKQRL